MAACRDIAAGAVGHCPVCMDLNFHGEVVSN